MRKFKVGDKVKRVKDIESFRNYGGNPEKVYTITGLYTEFSPSEIALEGLTGLFEGSKFELVDPVEEAISLLKEKGYSVEPPKPLTGEIIIYKNGRYYTICESKDYDEWDEEVKKNYLVIARVKWTEGDGLNEAPS